MDCSFELTNALESWWVYLAMQIAPNNSLEGERMPSRARQPAEFGNQRLLSEFCTYRAKAHQAAIKLCLIAWQISGFLRLPCNLHLWNMFGDWSCRIA
jgi:hypothetical protein